MSPHPRRHFRRVKQVRAKGETLHICAMLKKLNCLCAVLILTILLHAGNLLSSNRPKLKHRNSINLAVSTGHKHGKFKNVEAPKEEESDIIYEQKPVNIPVQGVTASREASASGRKAGRRTSLLRRKSSYEPDSPRIRTGRKIRFQDIENLGPIEHIRYSERLHYNETIPYDMEDRDGVDSSQQRPARCCIIS